MSKVGPFSSFQTGLVVYKVRLRVVFGICIMLPLANFQGIAIMLFVGAGVFGSLIKKDVSIRIQKLDFFT